MADLITRDDYKSYIGSNNPNDDAKIDLLLPAVSALVKGYCGLSFVDYVSSDKTDYFTITDEKTSVIFLTEGPIISITSVWERASQADSYTQLYTAGASSKYDYVYDSSIDTVTRTTSTSAAYWPIGYESVKILYKAGYATLPADLKIACFDLVTYYMKKEGTPQRNINGTSINNAQGSADNFPPHIRRVLDYYRVLL